MKVRIQDLTLERDGRRTLDGISLEIPSGHRLAVIGPNGAGKSTLLSAIAGVLTAQNTALSGSVSIGEDPAIEVLSARRGSLAERVSFMPQSLHLPFAHHVLDVVLMGGAHRRGAFGFASADEAAQAQRALEDVGVGHLARKAITQLSGGERQRVLFALQCVQGAPLMLLDEPTSAQDFRGTALMMQALRERTLSGATVIAAVHDLNLAARGFDTIALLEGGVLRAHDAPEKVLASAAMRAAYGGAYTVHQVEGVATVVPNVDFA